EVVEALNAVERDTDDARAGRRELVKVGGKGVRLQIAAAGIRRGVEVDDHRPALERALQGVGKRLARVRCGRGEFRRLLPGLQRRERGHGETGGGDQTQELYAHKYLHGSTLKLTR